MSTLEGKVALVTGGTTGIGLATARLFRDSGARVIVTGTNPAWPYPGLRVTGRQRLMRKEDLPAIMPYDFDSLLPRSAELAQWVELGIDGVICGVPGLVDTDEGVYELIDDLRTAGIALGKGSPPGVERVR